jgi:5-methylcytosine-specific restriction protein A
MAKSPATARPSWRSESNAEYEIRRRDNAPWRAWYGTARWRKIRAVQLAGEPLCCMCLSDGVVIAATVCDHEEPHRGDPAKFWSGPFQSLCAFHHNRDKQIAERTSSSSQNAKNFRK